MATLPTDDEPPSYSSLYDLTDDAVRLRDDGRVVVDLNSRLFRTLSTISTHRKQLEKDQSIPIPVSTETDQSIPIPVWTEEEQEAPIPVWTEQHFEPEPPIPLWTEKQETSASPPSQVRLNIVIQVVGSRGDVQPFVALGSELLKHGHRVRLATHGVFRDFALQAGLEFFDIGGDPAELMAYMVKNPGLIPSMSSLRAGEIQAKKKMMKRILRGCWSSCVREDPISFEPFVADAIIANPPSFAHIHCAQALGVPVHLMFTMPWTSTGAFSHPLAKVVNTKLAHGSTRERANYLSYMAVEWLTWQGLGDVINKWRAGMGLEEVHFSEGPLLAETLKVPFTYCWSPSLVPKPKDWGPHIDVCGFFFRETPKYEPDSALKVFLRGGDRPIYIGFGSIVVEDPAKLTKIILESVKAAGVRAIVSRGWSNIGVDFDVGPDVFLLGDCPHEWLFQHVSAVVHHGGAGTTACGLLNGLYKEKTDPRSQPFWGDMVAAAGAGPTPIPQKSLNVENLTDALRFCLTPEAASAARRIAEKMRSESGVQRAVASFHANLPSGTKMSCDILPDRPATWVFTKRGKDIKLSKEAAGMLVEEGQVAWKDLKRYDTKATVIDLTRIEPVSATASSLATVGSGMVGSAVNIVAKPIQAYSKPKMPRTTTAASSPTSTNQNSSLILDYPDPSRRAGTSTALTVLATPPTPSSSTSSPTTTTTIPSSALVVAAPRSPAPSPFKTALTGSASGAGGVLKHFSKGMLDAPLAVTEGLRSAPRLYGGEVYDPGRIDGVMSGGLVAGKNLAHGLVEGFGGLVMSPVRGAREDGAVGLVKGFGVGVANMGCKVPSGLLGLIFYPSQGAYKSIHTATHRKTRNDLKSLRQVESEWLARKSRKGSELVSQRFGAWLDGVKSEKRNIQKPETWFG